MIKSGVYNSLNRLLTVLYRSLPMYLTYASPWVPRGEERATAALKHVGEDQQRLATRVARYIIEHHGPIELGEYPIEFLDMHDLSLDFMITKLVEYQKCDLAALEQCVADLQSERAAAALAEEALGAARGHLETFEELAGQLAKAVS